MPRTSLPKDELEVGSSVGSAIGRAFPLLAKHRPDDVVAFGGAGTKTATDLLADAARISRALPASFENSHALLVFEHDRYAMAVALLGALDRGHAVALPQNTRRDSILAVHGRPETAIVVHDTDAGLPINILGLLEAGARGEPGPPPLSAPIVPREGVIATVFTSGTTGPVTPWPKTSAELLGEAESLAAAFDVPAGARIVGSVAPGHIYGLLFTVLLPLMRGAAFSRETPHHAEAVAHCVANHRADILVTVPVQLRSLGSLQQGALSNISRVFSSTGPLPDAVALAFSERHGLQITEILGSTETGGIASRSRALGAPERWKPFDQVAISVSSGGRLEVDSPFVYAGLPRPFETADLVELHEDGCFTHIGRADGIVKIGGRRVSIQEVEDCIRRQPGVEDTAVVAIPAEGGRGHQLLAAIVPAVDKPDEFALTLDAAAGNTQSNSVLTTALKTALLKKFEPTCLPRRFQIVSTIPKEANGKTPRDQILRLFDLQPDGRPMNWRLEWGDATIETDETGEHFERPVRVPEDYAWFDGHFEHFPVLAGAAQLKELILPTVAAAFPDLGVVTSMSRIKFSGRIIPGDSLVIRVERGQKQGQKTRQNRGRVVFEIRRSNEICSRGSLSLTEALAENLGEAPNTALHNLPAKSVRS